MNAGRLARFLQDTLGLWQIEGTVGADPVSGAIVVRGPRAAMATLERAPDGDPFRWYVRWHDGASEAAPRVRPCGSLVGVLTALRRAFGVERGSAIRIAPQPDEEDDFAPLQAPGASAGVAARACAASGADADAVGGRSDRPATASPSGGRIPVTVLTGFLGSGKTTLLGRLLRHPEMGRTAVIVNEFGEIGLDHDLIETSDESFVQLSTGCLCCNVRSDLVLTLADLAARRACGALAPFERVAIETSGLADPAPILHALMTDRKLAETYVFDTVVTTVDAITGRRTLASHPESARQVGMADTIVLTKTDLPQAETEDVAALVRRRNADARIMRAARGEIAPDAFFGRARLSPSSPEGFVTASAAQASAVDAPLPSPSGRAAGGEGEPSPDRVEYSWTPHPEHDHTGGIGTVSLVRTEPIHAATLALFVSALADNCGADLLRVKGIAQVSERPERPAVVHGVQHVYFAPRWLARWPSADRRTRIVFIGRAIPAGWPQALLDLLDAEVVQAAMERAA